MTKDSFRFLHAGDFHLDQPPGGLTEIPDELVDVLLDAPYKAVDRVFDAALSHRVDFVVLTGDLIHFPTASSRALAFLRTQLERLRDQNIPVYWLGGRLESGPQGITLPDGLALPENVHLLPAGRVQQLATPDDDKTLAYVVGQSASDHAFANLDDLRCPRDGRFFTGLWYGGVDEIDFPQLDELGIDYWALGGRHNFQRLDTVIPASYCGTPQGRLPSEHGPHGCVFVSVDGSRVDAQFLEADTVRYQTERLEMNATDDEQRLVERMLERLRAVRGNVDAQRHLLVSWELVHDGDLGRELRRAGGGERRLAQWQRELHEAAGGNVWSIRLHAVRGPAPPGLWEQDTILGNYLRVVRELEQTDSPLLDARAYLPDGPAAERLVESLHLDDTTARRQLLHEVAAVGIDMLSGD